MTEKQKRFVDAYMGECRGVAIDAYEKAYGRRDHRMAAEVLHHPLVEEAIIRRQRAREALSWFTEDMVLQGLYEEATREGKGSNSASRISAWVWIGKHIGMWKEKKEEEKQETQITYNIVNYNNEAPNKKQEEKEIECIEEKPSQEIDGVSLISYAENEGGKEH